MNKALLAVIVVVVLLVGLFLGRMTSTATNASLPAAPVAAEMTPAAAAPAIAPQPSAAPVAAASTASVVANKPEQAPEAVESLDELLTDNGQGNDALRAKALSQMSATQLEQLITNLDQQLTEQYAVTKKAGLQDGVNDYFNQHGELLQREFQCSNKLCGLILESVDNDQVQLADALDSLSATPEFKKLSRGGTLMIKQQDGRYLGVMITSISQQPLTIQAN
ncbi:hypothetical protein JYB87_17075 [Shewanella avicenniae]|uniref:Uncharacterized protein n=1 Tax=Shewanella avicenniae TaxID=2814294 RepID=A0ABX7QPK7_9GAMM|nr:hypothetical protein [Shewanella avicenniae]QSX33406.1 hypothetical protein JYB87_17075 [Shewanella avicenniae]